MKHKIVLVIGGASGIGRGICEVMASKGATIAIADIVEDNAKEVENELTKDGYEAKAYQIDVTNSNNLDKIITKIITDFGQIFIVLTSISANLIFAPIYKRGIFVAVQVKTGTITSSPFLISLKI